MKTKMNTLLKNKNARTNALTYLVVIAAFLVTQYLYSADALSSSVKGYLIPICVYISLAVSLNLLVGICGELSLGHAGFMGIGAFSGIVIAALLKDTIPNDALRLLCAMFGGGILAGAVGFVIGVPVLRLRGDYLAIVTLAFGEILKNIIGNTYAGIDESGFHMAISTTKMPLETGGKYIINGPLGATGIQKIATFPMGFVLVLFTLFVVLNLINSKEGRAIKAVRDNRIAAESVGINVTAFRMKAFVVSAFLAGMAGALFGLNYSSVTASKFNFNTSIFQFHYIQSFCTITVEHIYPFIRHPIGICTLTDCRTYCIGQSSKRNFRFSHSPATIIQRIPCCCFAIFSPELCYGISISHTPLSPCISILALKNI